MMKWLKRKNDIAEKVSIEESTEEFIQYFKEFVKDSDPLTIKKLIKFVASSIQGQLLTKCFYNNRNYADYINQVKNSLLLDLLDHDAVHNEKINISTTPIISCVWNNSRLMGALSKINHLAGNPFDGNDSLRCGRRTVFGIAGNGEWEKKRGQECVRQCDGR